MGPEPVLHFGQARPGQLKAGEVAGDLLAVVDMQPRSAVVCDITTGSLSTYSTRAAGFTPQATSWVLGLVGRPEPTSMNWAVHWRLT
jgi:hypothetical protein